MLTKCVACEKTLKDVKRVRGLAHCPSCGHYSFRNPVGERKYDREYFEKYNQYEATPLGHAISRTRWDLVQKYAPSTASRILDWGCGNGAFVRAKPNGHIVEGHDVNPFSPYKRPSAWVEEWDIVTMFDVVEHLFQPHLLVTRTKPQVFVVLTPVSDSVKDMDDFLRWKHYRPDEHQHYFTLKSLELFFHRCGYDVKEYNYDEGALRDPKHPEFLATMVGERRGKG